MLNGKPLGPPYNSEGNITFGNGWKFKLNVLPDQSGTLYVISVGLGENGADEYNVLFPGPAGTGASTKLDAQIAANKTMQLPNSDEWYRFMGRTGVENLWMIWSIEPIKELDAIFTEAANNKDNPLVIGKADQIEQVKSYLKQYDTSRVQVANDKAAKRTSMRGFGSVVVYNVQLSHEAY
jgi:hypothetical protein